MGFEITSDDHVVALTEGALEESERSGSRFATEQEFQELAGAWPMKRLVEIWNRLPGVQPVRKFENRPIAIAADLARDRRRRRTGRSRCSKP